MNIYVHRTYISEKNALSPILLRHNVSFVEKENMGIQKKKKAFCRAVGNSIPSPFNEKKGMYVKML